MIISKTPVRISIGGGGTDLPSYYRQFGSHFISAAIDKYIYIIVQERKFFDEFLLKYSKTELVKKVGEIDNELIRGCLRLLKITTPLEIVSISDVGGQSGLGSSGSFTVGLLNALHAFKREVVSQEQLAEEACHIAIDVLKLPSGKQDEYIASFGGVSTFRISKSGKVRVSREFEDNFIHQLEYNLYLFGTGIFRDSKTALTVQQKATNRLDLEVITNLKTTQRLGKSIRQALLAGNGHLFGQLMHKHWLNKRRRALTTNSQIDGWYELALNLGAVGGKIMGAGGGGFFLFYFEGDAPKFINLMEDNGLWHVPFGFDAYGSKVIVDF